MPRRTANAGRKSIFRSLYFSVRCFYFCSLFGYTINAALHVYPPCHSEPDFEAHTDVAAPLAPCVLPIDRQCRAVGSLAAGIRGPECRRDVCCEVSSQVFRTKEYDAATATRACYNSMQGIFEKSQIPRRKRVV